MVTRILADIGNLCIGLTCCNLMVDNASMKLHNLDYRLALHCMLTIEVIVAIHYSGNDL